VLNPDHEQKNILETVIHPDDSQDGKDHYGYVFNDLVNKDWGKMTLVDTKVEVKY
jgi:hypothetical protein